MSVQLFCSFFFLIGKVVLGLPWWLSSKESTCDAGATGDAGSIPGSGRSREEGYGNSLQYSCLGNPMDRKEPVHGVAKESDIAERLNKDNVSGTSLSLLGAFLHVILGTV